MLKEIQAIFLWFLKPNLVQKLKITTLLIVLTNCFAGNGCKQKNNKENRHFGIHNSTVFAAQFDYRA